MPFMPPPETDERDGLLKFLAAQRQGLRASLFGLDRDQRAVDRERPRQCQQCLY